MTDENCTKWVLPAISLGYAVVNDPEGKLKFWNKEAVIIYRDGWLAFTDSRETKYPTLQDAIEAEAIDDE